MRKNRPTFFAIVALTAVMMSAALGVAPGRAHAYGFAYAQGGTSAAGQAGSVSASSGASQAYDFGNSFNNLVSPFTKFFDSIKMSGNNTLTVSGNVSGLPGGTAAPNVTVNVSLQPYINQFDAWFYGFTGVHADGAIRMTFEFFNWVFAVANGAVTSIAKVLMQKGQIPLK